MLLVKKIKQCDKNKLEMHRRSTSAVVLGPSLVFSFPFGLGFWKARWLMTTTTSLLASLNLCVISGCVNASCRITVAVVMRMRHGTCVREQLNTKFEVEASPLDVTWSGHLICALYVAISSIRRREMCVCYCKRDVLQ